MRPDVGDHGALLLLVVTSLLSLAMRSLPPGAQRDRPRAAEAFGDVRRALVGNAAPIPGRASR